MTTTHQERWEGVVEDVDETTFSGRVICLTNSSEPEYWEEFSKADVPREQRYLIAPGAMFCRVVVFEYGGEAPPRVSSTITFPDIRWTVEQLAEIERRAAELGELMGVSDVVVEDDADVGVYRRPISDGERARLWEQRGRDGI